MEIHAGDATFVQRRLKQRRELLARLQETPRLRVLSGPCEGHEHWVEALPSRIGRGAGNHVALADPSVEQLACVLRAGPTGQLLLVAHDPSRAPLLERRLWTWKARANVPVRDGLRVKLGEGGPTVEVRYLGGADARRSLAVLLLGAGGEDPLLPLPHLVARLDEQRFSGGVSPTARYFIDHAVRYLEQLRFYRRWTIGWGLLLMVFSALVIYFQISTTSAHAELSSARDQIRAQYLSEQRRTEDREMRRALGVEKSPFDGDRVAEGMLQILSASGVLNPEIDAALVAMVKAEIQLESARLTRRFDLAGFFERQQRYHPRIQDIFEREYQLPRSLAYVAWVESDYRLDAESPVGALGMWQFMEGTAVSYGLITEGGEDYRLNFESSTRAAARMFSDLLAQFGSEQLLVAIASYNWGPARISQLMRQHRLWQPAQRGIVQMLALKTAAGEPAMPEETRRFVARFFAVQLISEDKSFYLGSAGGG